MLVFISDLHLTDGTAIRQDISAKQVQDFWHNINRSKKSLLPFRKREESSIELVILGDFLDLLRTEQWERPENQGIKPWSAPSLEQKKVVEKIIAGIFSRNKETIDTLRAFVGAKQVKARYMIGNHDHLLLRYPDLFRKVHEQLGFEFPEDSRTIQFYEKSWTDYGVFAHHGDRGDPWNDTRGLFHPIGDAMVTEVYNRFPARVSRAISGGDILKQALENLVFVRPYRYTPYWIIQVTRQYGEENSVKKCWNELIEEFMEVDFVRMWIRETTKISKLLNPANSLKATLRISLNFQFRGWLAVTRTFNLLSNMLSITPRSVRKLRNQIELISDARIRYLVNGHTHNACMIPLGKGQAGRLAYVNTGTWTRVWLPDRLNALEPARKPIKSFTPGDYISYAMFYTQEENPSHDMEFWSGRINPREG